MDFEIIIRWTDTGRTDIIKLNRNIDPKDIPAEARKICDDYNRSCGEEEPKKELVYWRVLPSESESDKVQAQGHYWEFQKATKDIKGSYDAYICKHCGAEGRRRELNGEIILDKKFRTEVFEKCPGDLPF